MTEAHILVVDDEEAMRRSLADILRLDGHKVDSAQNSAEALRLLADNTYDLALLDLKMPGMSGVELMAHIRQQAPGTQVIMLTAHGSLESAIDALRMGAHDYLLKPCPPKQISKSVRLGLEKRAQRLQEAARRGQILDQLEQSVKALRSAGGLEMDGAGEESAAAISSSSGGGIAKRAAGEGQAVKTPAVSPPAAGLPSETGMIFPAQKAAIPDAARLRAADSNLILLRLPDEHESSGVWLDISRREVCASGSPSGSGSAAAGQRIRLTPAEGRLLELFARHPGRVFTHRELVEAVQGYALVEDWEAAEVLRPLVSRLRQKLNHLEGGRSWIVNVRSTGYVFDASPMPLVRK